MRLVILTAIALGLIVGHGKQIDAAQPLWQKLVPRKLMEADLEAEYTLSKDRGPWLILAATFSGPEAKDCCIFRSNGYHPKQPGPGHQQQSEETAWATISQQPGRNFLTL